MTKNKDDTVTWDEAAEGTGYTGEELKSRILERLTKIESGETKTMDAEEEFWEQHGNDPEGLERFYRLRDAYFRGELDVSIRRIVDPDD